MLRMNCQGFSVPLVLIRRSFRNRPPVRCATWNVFVSLARPRVSVGMNLLLEPPLGAIRHSARTL